MKTVAYLHPTADHCVSVDPKSYANPRRLVLRSEAVDEITRLRAELAECRREHLANIEYAVSCLGQIYGMLDAGRLDQAEDFCRGAAETFTQDIDALAAKGENT